MLTPQIRLYTSSIPLIYFIFNYVSSYFVFSSRRRHTRSVSAFLLNRSSDLNQKEIAEMQNETQKEIAGIQSATSRQNTKDQVYAQNEMLAYQQKESTARVASIMENTN